MAKKSIIAGNTFLFTGKLTEFTREEAEAHVEAEGGKVLSGVSAKLNYLVVGEEAGSKLAKAEALGTVTILHEKEFLKMMKKTTASKSITTKAPAKKTEKTVVAKTASKSNVEIKDSKSINEVTIGKQVWMTQNLNVLKFRNGDDIKLAKNVSEWKKLNEKEIPACCYYEGDDAVKDNKTLLYNWFAVIDKRGLSPKGWVVPAVADWDELYSFVGGDKKAVRKLKSKEVWDGSPFLVKLTSRPPILIVLIIKLFILFFFKNIKINIQIKINLIYCIIMYCKFNQYRFKQKSLATHPTRNPNDLTVNMVKFKEICEAFDVLS
jgi:uncharacterized protein (TIGR02145 family)